MQIPRRDAKRLLKILRKCKRINDNQLMVVEEEYFASYQQALTEYSKAVAEHGLNYGHHKGFFHAAKKEGKHPSGKGYSKDEWLINKSKHESALDMIRRDLKWQRSKMIKVGIDPPRIASIWTILGILLTMATLAVAANILIKG